MSIGRHPGRAVLVTLFAAAGCVSQSEFDKLQSEHGELKARMAKLEARLASDPSAGTLGQRGKKATGGAAKRSAPPAKKDKRGKKRRKA